LKESTEVMVVGNIIDDWGGPNPWLYGNVTVPDVIAQSPSDQVWRVSTGLSMFTKLGLVDLQVNYPPPASP
jgi:hypothetical protein